MKNMGKKNKKKKESTIMRNETKCITTDVKVITKGYYEWLYTDKFDNLDEMDQFFEKHKGPNSPNIKQSTEL